MTVLDAAQLMRNVCTKYEFTCSIPVGIPSQVAKAFADFSESRAASRMHAGEFRAREACTGTTVSFVTFVVLVLTRVGSSHYYLICSEFMR